MDPNVQRDYYRLRSKGWAASHALRAAKIRVAFEEAEAEGLVRIRIVPDEDCDLEFLLGEGLTERQKEHEIARINSEGAWGIIGEYVTPACPCCGHGGTWTQGDSVWGFVGDDVEDNGYDTDIMSTTLDALRAAQEKVARHADAHAH